MALWRGFHGAGSLFRQGYEGDIVVSGQGSDQFAIWLKHGAAETGAKGIAPRQRCGVRLIEPSWPPPDLKSSA